ncbi:MAG: DUF421 domain-containing protein [Hyphomicrobiaceae bacterium]|nr:DUF421 domain-containing protein [Hyphomicrobiaceae bacterium]
MAFEQMFFQSWPEVVRTVLIGGLAYIVLIVFLRISGKRTLAKLNAFDLVVTVALGSTLSSILLDQSIALAEGAAALAVLIFLQFAVSFLSVRWQWFAHFVRSSPSTLVENGRTRPATMRSERITEDEIVSAIRASGGHHVSDASTVVLESDGTISVSLYEKHPKAQLAPTSSLASETRDVRR